MRYVGSKNRISKDITPVIQQYVDEPWCKGYIEPFVGGANMIDKIRHENRFGFDSHKFLIALLQKAQSCTDDFPETISEDTYNKVKSNPEQYEDWFVGLVGFCSFGAKWFGGYRRSYDKDGNLKEETAGVIRNLKKQAEKLKGITFRCYDFRRISPDDVFGYVIYCDPPYRDTTKYSTGKFPYEEFYDWCRAMSKNNVVLVSEYWMPEDFKCIWEKQLKCTLSKGERTKRSEKLFILE